MSECSCWVKYPNPMHKGKNGKWKCVDQYKCIQDLETVETPIGLTAVRKKTHCRRKTSMEEETKKTTGDLIRREDALAIFGDIHPLDYNANAYREEIKALPGIAKETQEAEFAEVRLDLEKCPAHIKRLFDCGERIILDKKTMVLYIPVITAESFRKYCRGKYTEVKENKTTEGQEELESIKADICDQICKWPDVWDEESQGLLCESELCADCPVNRL